LSTDFFVIINYPDFWPEIKKLMHVQIKILQFAI